MVTLAIVAGGKGTRLGRVHATRPKCLTPIGGKPVIAHQIELAMRCGIERVIVLTGYGADQVEAFVGDGSQFGVEILCHRETHPGGTAGCFSELGDLWDDTLLVLYGDVMCNFDMARFIAFHRNKSGLATLLVHPNDHPFDSDLLEVDTDQRVQQIHCKPHSPSAEFGNLVNAAAYLVEPDLKAKIPPGKSDWAHDVFPSQLAAGEKIYAYRSSEYLKDMGTPERLERVSDDFASGKIARASYAQPRPAIFLDRDGTINREVDLCHKLEDFVLLPGVAQAIRRINCSEYLAIVITNQPVIARGLCDLDGLAAIHRKMETRLGEEGAYVDALYFCPHHPDSGYPGENRVYKVDCGCRKPAPGLLDLAAREHNIDLSASYFIGDTTRDVATGLQRDLTTILVETGYGGRDGKCDVSPHFHARDLDQAVAQIMNGETA